MTDIGSFQLTDEAIRMKVRCRACGQRIGLVFTTPCGDLWWGFVNNQPAKSARKLTPNDLSQYAEPTWMEPASPFYFGECRCGRNAADGRVVHAALLAGKAEVAVPPRLEAS